MVASVNLEIFPVGPFFKQQETRTVLQGPITFIGAVTRQTTFIEIVRRQKAH